ncbi:MAG: IS481 family transposase [Gemmatimonadota bacterium]
MNVHKNAKLTPTGRAQMIERLEAGESVTEVAASVGVSRTTVYKWWKRWKAEGEAGLEDRSCRPHRSPNRLLRHRRRQIERLRRKRWSTPRIARETGIPLSTVGLECRRLGLGRLKALGPSQPVIRYERDRPGELLHLDIKKLGRIGRVGHRIHGDRRRRARGVGWEYLHVCVDDASRVAYAEILPDEKKERVTAFTERAIRWFEDRGVGIQRIMTDNGPGYRSKLLRKALEARGVKHIFTRPYTPRTNGKAERFIRTALQEWAYARPYGHSNERTAALTAFLNYYNCGRPHGGIDGDTPQQRLSELALHNVLEKHN